ncbi:hypothetical protein HanPSC8_Chr02g0083471 [Helianthus annuus]|nr:hypothetical protein HanPSC8_Chr02g0083471 [Helianthus annuus]
MKRTEISSNTHTRQKSKNIRKATATWLYLFKASAFAMSSSGQDTYEDKLCVMMCMKVRRKLITICISSMILPCM